MITKRPTLPTGHTIGGLPPVERVVHSDDRCEVYGLQALGEYPLLLLFASTAGGAAKSPRELAAWWAVQPAEVLKVIQSLAPEDCPPQMIGVAFEARGALL